MPKESLGKYCRPLEKGDHNLFWVRVNNVNQAIGNGDDEQVRCLENNERYSLARTQCTGVEIRLQR